MKGVGEQIMKEACNEVCYLSRIIGKGNERVMLTQMFQLMAPGRSEDLLHLMVVLLRYRVYIISHFCQCCINTKDNKKYDHAFYNKPILSHCLHGKTQNQKGPFNGIIWKRVLKQCFVKLKIFKIGVYDSVAHFNVGNLVTLLIYDAVGIDKSLNELWMGVSTMMYLE